MAERTTSQVLGATLLGGAVGATLALLFAPRSGKETRQRLTLKAQEMKADATDTLSLAKAKAREGADSARDFKAKVGRVVHEKKEDIKGKVAHGDKALSAWEEEV